MFNQVVAVLTKYGYGVGFSSYHTDQDIKTYSQKPDRVSSEKFFTVYSPEGYVVGRVHQFKENSKFKIQFLETIIGYFKMFEIVHHQEIVEELDEILLHNIKRGKKK